MSDDEPRTHAGPRSNRGRLRRSGLSLLRLGALLGIVSLVVTLLAGWATRSMLDHLQSNSAELLDGSATVRLAAGTDRTLYVTGGLISPGETVPTPVEQISCTIEGPTGSVPFADLASEGKRVGLDTALARFQVIGSFTTQSTGDHDIRCDGLGVVMAPEVEPASVAARLGGLMLGSAGTFLGLTMALIGGVLLLIVRHGTEGDDEDDDVPAAPPEEGAEEWWEDEVDPEHARRSGADGADGASDDDGYGEASVPGDVTGEGGEFDDEYVEVTDEELAAMSEEEIAELVASGALVFVDDDDEDSDGDDDSGEDEVEPGSADGQQHRDQDQQ